MSRARRFARPPVGRRVRHPFGHRTSAAPLPKRALQGFFTRSPRVATHAAPILVQRKDIIMICLALGLGVLGFAAARAAHRRCHGGGCHSNGHYGHWGRHGGWGHRGRNARRRWMLHAMLTRIDATPAQERAIVHEIDKLEERLRTTKGALRETRGDLGAALRGPTLDDAALGAVLGRVDGATAEARAAIVDALRNLHGLLDDRQRGQLADLLEAGVRGGWAGGGGPYRM